MSLRYPKLLRQLRTEAHKSQAELAEVLGTSQTMYARYDGKNKRRCKIGDGAFIGCNTNLVAPVEVGDRAYIAAGSTITDDIPGDALSIARARQVNKPGWVTEKKPYKEKK